MPRCNRSLLLGLAIYYFLLWMGASSAQTPGWTTSQFRGTPTPPLPYTLELAFPKLKFTHPKCVVPIPGTQQLLVAHDGKLVSFSKADPNVDATSLVANLSQVEKHQADAHTVVFHPEFLRNRFMYVAMAHGEGGGHNRVMRYQLSDDQQPAIVPNSGKLIIRWPGGGHSGGGLGFGKDGFLYVSTGDGTGPSPPDGRTTGQDVSDLLGAVLRIDVDTTDQPYRIPSDNPFVDLDRARPEIWSYGLRNPWKFGIDPHSGAIFVADNGWETWEMIHKLHSGSNCGWPIMEGRAELRMEVERGPTPITPPIKDHPHTEANSVIGGPVYWGPMFPGLHGTFVYGDYITGTIWGLRENSDGSFEHRTLADCDLHIVAFTEGIDGEIYLLDYDTTQQLYRLKRSDAIDHSSAFPRKLSQTGLFQDVVSLQPAQGVMPYTIAAEPWSDGAVARRFVAVPHGHRIRFVDEGTASFPQGTVLAKHLSMPIEGRAQHVPLETQVLHYADGQWNPYSYLWHETGTEATLVESQGTDREIQTSTDPDSRRTWHVGSTNECRLCHNAGSDVVLGFTARQLQTSGSDQLARWHAVGVLAEIPTASELPKLVNPYDERADLDHRGRSYLHINCGICHNRQGPATISFFAHRDYDFTDLRITKHPGIGTFGIRAPQLVAPGDPYSSIILYRIAKLGYGRMPYVGSRVVDSQGVTLVDRWIRSLADNSSQDDLRRSDTESLLRTTEGALALASMMHGRTTDVDGRRIREKTAALHGDIRGLFEHFVPERQRKATLGVTPDPTVILERQGSVARGELIFQSDNARCRSCHHEHDAQQSVGPTLADIRKQFPRRRDMLLHILQPSEKVDAKYRVWNVTTTDGRSHMGVLVAETADAIKLRTVQREEIVIANREIATKHSGERSLMPTGVLSNMTAQQAADLLAFLCAPAD